MVDYSFLENRISKENIGEHDEDNRFLMERFNSQIERYLEDRPGCTLIGVCYEEPHPSYKGYYPIVYEDENGNRFWTHWCIDTAKEYKEVGLLKTPIQGGQI